VISSHDTTSRAIRWCAGLMVFVFGCVVLPVGCGGDPISTQSEIPADFAQQLEKEHPELFVKKVGKNKTEVLGGRDKKELIRREWQKSLGQ
jgi:hypothetical protein